MGPGGRRATLDGVPENHFDEPIAARYDDDLADQSAPETLAGMLDLLAELAGAGGRTLEFAIGTGRVALPLAKRGLHVEGIELSEAMVAQLRAKPGGTDLPVTVGDMATTRVDGQFDLVFLVFNTILNLTTQDEQVACFQNAAAHLRPGGHFVIETIVPSLRSMPPGERFHVFHHGPDHTGVDEYDVVTQRATSHHYTRRADGWELTSMPFRYAWPSELDLMARLAGMDIVGRWADWDRSPFTADSASHVSVWRRPEP